MSKNNKHGLLKYKYGLNLGDTIQSLAALQFVTPELYFDRDYPSETPIKGSVDEVRIIMNAYWSGWNGSESTWGQEIPLNEKIKPLWTSCHFDGGCQWTEEVVNYFKKFEPIGCRDLWTLNKLKEQGIEAYFSNCLTITLENAFQTRGDDIYIVDVPRHIYEHFPKDILDHATFLTHESKWAAQGKEPGLYKFDEASVLLHKYMRAKLVITSRLHCATPCVAVGTPVVFIGNQKSFYRVNCLEEYIPLYSYDNFSAINWSIEKIKNKTHYSQVNKRKAEFRKLISSFISK